MRSSSRYRRAGFPLEAHRAVAQFFAWGLFFVFAWLKLGRRYRIADLARIRGTYRSLAVEARGPLVICATHPTRADGPVLLWALASPLTYLRHPSRYPWIVADPGLFRFPRLQKSLGLFWKSVYIRQGAGLKKNESTIQRIERLLDRNETVLLFPEGTREDGHPSYLLGRLLEKFPEATVLCLALTPCGPCERREMPRNGTRFQISPTAIAPRARSQGARAAWDLARRVQEELSP